MISFKGAASFSQEASIILLDKEQIKKKSIPNVNAALNKEILNVIASNKFTAEGKEVFPLIHKSTTVLLVGLGDKKDLSHTAYRIFVRFALLSAFVKKSKSIEILLNENTDENVRNTIEAILIGTYVWDKYKLFSKDKNTAQNKKYTICVKPKTIYETFIKVCHGTNLARDLVNDNADTVNSKFIEKTIKDLVKGHKNVALEILNEKELKQKGLGLHLAVNKGSANEPKLIIVKYTGDPKKKGYTALIGKGMTFDSGGLNLKPTGSIETMKMDMGGTATVVGTLKNVLSLKLKKNILFVCGLAENVTGSKSYKPGDVIKGYAGKTVEVANTDAEGRLVLADAISYVVKNYKPERLIDIATLTGAVIVALGHDYTGLVSTDDDFARKLVHSSNTTDDRAWRLPSYPELKTSVSSNIADIRNLGFPKGAGGCITAAEFLRQFTENTKWAHLDIAGSTFVEATERFYFSHGATGSGVRLLTHFIQNN